MNRLAVTALIVDRIREFCERSGTAVPRSLSAESPLFGDDGVGLDSLDLAILILELETQTGRQPFRDGLAPFQTVSDLAALFAVDG